TTFDAQYKFSGKERDIETGYGYFGARYYSSELGIWISTDPLSDKYPSTTPFAYCRNNPIMLIDPNGMDDDWVQNNKTGEYEWHDNVTSSSNTPEGYSYVGKTGNDILGNLGVSSNYETKTDMSVGIGTVGGDGNGTAGSGSGNMGNGVIGGTADNVIANLSINADINMNPDNATENNVNGWTFNGVTVTGSVSENQNPDSGGNLFVNTNNKSYSKHLEAPSGSILSETNKKQSTASIHVPASALRNPNYLQSATIGIGRPNNATLLKKPTEINWNLQTHTMLRQGK
ncbi:MAG: RHS repeat-associated core domain-containing protein, partial [Bacteroidales bacterium]|nr:RHS repeat-associated core domain-containing protein [Bacteroidales bacterium]